MNGTRNQYNCVRCGWSWLSSLPGGPRNCARCKAVNYNIIVPKRNSYKIDELKEYESKVFDIPKNADGSSVDTSALRSMENSIHSFGRRSGRKFSIDMRFGTGVTVTRLKDDPLA